MPLPCPAPVWISTRCLARVSSSTPTGMRATRYSSVLISLGTPTIMTAPRPGEPAVSRSILERPPGGIKAKWGTAMSQDEAWLRAIADAPDDDAPRLAYADWLEEHG